MEFSRIFKGLSPKSFFSYLNSALAPKNKNRITHVTSSEMTAKIDFLRIQYMNDKNMSFSIEGILDAIKANNSLMLRYILDELSFKKNHLSDESKEAFIFIAAGLGRVSILQVMCDVMDDKLVLENPLAKALLAHPYRELINNLCAEHLDGLGKFYENNIFNVLQSLQALHNNVALVAAFAKENIRQDVAIGTEGGIYHDQMYQPPVQLTETLKADSLDNSTVVTRAGFMGATSMQSVDRYYDPKLHHHSVDAYVETRMAPTVGSNMDDSSYKFVAWLVNRSSDDLEKIMGQGR